MDGGQLGDLPAKFVDKSPWRQRPWAVTLGRPGGAGPRPWRLHQGAVGRVPSGHLRAPRTFARRLAVPAAKDFARLARLTLRDIWNRTRRERGHDTRPRYR